MSDVCILYIDTGTKKPTNTMKTKKENNKINSQPTVTMMVGGPGAGKSYVRNQILPDAKVLDCDDLKKFHPDYDPKNITSEIHEWSAQELAKRYFKELSEGNSFVYDGTGTNLERYIKWINHAHEAGFKVELIYVKCSLKVALERNQQRERTVPEYIVKEKHSTVESSFSILKNYADNAIEIDNS